MLLERQDEPQEVIFAFLWNNALQRLFQTCRINRILVHNSICYSDQLHNYRCSVYAANAVIPVCAQFLLSDVPHEAVFKFLRNCELSFLLATDRHYHQLVTNSTVLCDRRLADCTARIVAELQSNASSSSLHVCAGSLHDTSTSESD